MSTTDIAPDTIGAPDATTRAGATSATAADARPRSGAASIAAVFTSADSKVIGRTMIGFSLVVLAATAVVGALLGAERLDGADSLFDADALPQLFVVFRIGLVYGALVPLLLGLAVAIVPLQVGARSLAFPRLAAAGMWAWLSGLVLVMVALADNGGPGGGNPKMVELFLAGHGLLVIGLAAPAASVATTVLTSRAPGLRMSRLPFFAWSSLISAVGLLLVLPVVLGVLVYLFIDHHNTRALFGGNAGVGSWIGFTLTQPATFLFALPAIGITAELIPPTFRRRMPLRGVVFAGLALIGFAALSAVTQQAFHELPWSGKGLDLEDFGRKFDDLLPYAMFVLLPILGVVIVLALGALAAKPERGSGARPNITPAFLVAFFGLGMVLVGMLGGALVPITDLGLQGTVFEEAALVYVVYGGVLGALGGIAWWWPKWSGRTLPTGPTMGLALLPYYVAGFADQPAGSGTYDYEGPSALWNAAVMVGHALMFLTVLAFLGLLLRPSRTDRDGQRNPAGGQTLEWLTTSPAPAANFAEVPTVMSPEPVLDLEGPEGAAR
jgi:heme/copper-type cytochrome/quinol oxidase subunit 1